MEKVGLAVWRNGTLLTVRKHGHASFILPGGKAEDFDSDDEETLGRELREELGCEFDRTSLQWVGIFTDESADDPGSRITVRLFRGDLVGTPAPAAEIAEYKWFDPSTDDPSLLAPSIRNSILPFLLSTSE